MAVGHPAVEVYRTERVVAQTEMRGLCVDHRPDAGVRLQIPTQSVPAVSPHRRA